MKGKFITLEGIEGSGKSTMLEFIRDFLKTKGLPVECTREPGGTKKAEEIRSLLLTYDPDENLSDKSELLLMYAARAQLVEKKIRPCLEAGISVISDRFDMSTVAYQGYGRGFDLSEIAKVRSFAIGDFCPDLTLLFDCDVQIGMRRVIQRGKRDRFELEEQEFFERIRKGYLAAAQQNPDRICIIDSSSDIEHVKLATAEVLEKKLFS